MIIKSISIENFQSYYEKQTIEFSEGLNLIIGKGGKGKSKLFNAFYWVLFGKIYITDVGWVTTDGLPFSAQHRMQKHQFVNKRALVKANESERISTTVVMELIDDKGDLFEIERSVITTKGSMEDWKSSQYAETTPSTLKVSYDSPTGTVVKHSETAEGIILSLFPDGIRDYIWFQGESLDDLIDFKNRETLKKAVKHISYFPYYEKLAEIIRFSKESIQRRERASIKKANEHNDEVKSLVRDIEKYARLLEKEEAAKSQLESDIEIIKVKLTDNESKMTGLASFTNLVNRYKSCEIEIQKLNDELARCDEYQREQLPKLWILRGIEPMIERCKEIIKNHTEIEETMPERKYLDNPSRAKLEEILHDGKCFVCGSDTSKGTTAHEYIMNRIKAQEEYLKEMEDYTNNMKINKLFNMLIGKIQDYPDNLKWALYYIDKKFQENEDTCDDLRQKRSTLLQRKSELDIEIEDVKKKHGVDPVKNTEGVQVLDSSIKASRRNLESLQRKLGNSKSLINQYSSEKRVAEKKLSAVGTTSSFHSVLETEWKEISEYLEDVCKRVKEKARVELLKRVEKRANEYYKKFTEHDNGYKGSVKISEDYSIEFDPGLNTSHEDRKKMSIINALLSLNQEAMNTYYPFISDAPTSSFDTDTTPKYLLGVKDIFHQSIIMTKDVVIDSDYYNALMNEPKVSNIYELQSKLYCEDGTEPDLHEVSTVKVKLK